MAIMEKYIEVFEKNQHSVHAKVEFWIDHVLFSWQWWLMVAAFLLLWALFFLLKRKETLPRIIIYGLFWIIVASNLDGLGYENGLWGYPYSLSPFLSFSYIFDYCLIPITYMLIYQYFPKGKSFFFANVILSLGSSLIAEPISEWFNIYLSFHWKVYYSPFLYFTIAYLLKFLTDAIMKTSLKNQA